MTRRSGLGILVLCVLVLGGAVSPAEVQACSMRMPEADERIALFSEHSEAAVVGTVVEEVVTKSPYGSDAFRSTVRVVAALDGNAPSEIVLEDLGYLGGDCSGGRRLEVGNRYLLFLSTRQTVNSVNHLPDGEWRVAPAGMGTYLLHDGESAFYPMGSPVPGDGSMAADALIREVASALGSDPVEVERAIAFANGAEPPPRVAEEASNPVTVWGSVGVALIAVGILAGWYLRGRSRRRR